MGSNPKRLATSTGNIVLKTAIKFTIFLGMKNQESGWAMSTCKIIKPMCIEEPFG